ncbi:hypothetical protein [Streptomyces sp. NBC_00525]|uniref:hypothetical protein n=1 Tax=Streptomyces sp. NBC_00525 TaxID=2903660 RepID=UPI002E808B4F|nr:hypothetical protein [Streptomyces sp. NBC_00525]WUC97499.1 hypothetical protein OG710_29490 [Streptomyces sp. NBC_00525]
MGKPAVLLLTAGVGVLVLALVAGLGLLGDDHSRSPASSDDAGQTKPDPRLLAPYRLALVDLVTAPGLRYKDDLPGGMMEREVTVTSAGSRFGSNGFGSAELDREFLNVGGKTFTRWRLDPAAEAGKKKPSRWDAGADVNDGLTDELTEHRPAPPELAASLLQALADLEANPGSDGYTSEHRNVDGVPARALDTPAGRMVITAGEPYRLLRLERPEGAAAGGSARTVNYAVPAEDDAESTGNGPFDGKDTVALDLEPVGPAEAPAMYDTLEKQTKELSQAGDSGISLSMRGDGSVRCSAGGCTATGHFSGQITTDAKARLTGGRITAVMTSTFTIDGRSGGSCTSPAATFPVKGGGVSGRLTCSNPGAGGTFVSVEAQKKSEARARSRANGGRPVRYTIPLRANSLISARALATVEVKRLVKQVGKERGGAEPCSAFRDFRSGFLAPEAATGGAMRQVRTELGPPADRAAERKKDPLNFGSNYTGRLDRFEIGGKTDFEIHVYRSGREIGIFGSNGWFAKHGKSADVQVPREVYNLVKGLAVGELRRDGRIGSKGTENIKGDNWKRKRITGGC